MLAVEYQGKRLNVNTIGDIDRVQKFIAEYRRHLTEAQRLAEAEALLFSAPPVPSAPVPPTETAPSVETAEAVPPVSANIVPAPPAPARGRPSLPPVGQRTIDYTLRVLEAAGGRLPFAQVVTGMQAIGWTTSSAEPRAIANNIRSAHNKCKEWVQIDGDMLVLTDVGRDVLRETRAKQDASATAAP